MCYAKLLNGQWEIYTNDLAGSNRQDVSNYAGDDEYPQWSPDGRYIAYSRSANYVQTQIYVYDTKTKNDTNMTSDGGEPGGL